MLSKLSVRALALTASAGVFGLLAACQPAGDVDVDSNGDLETTGCDFGLVEVGGTCSPEIVPQPGGTLPLPKDGDGSGIGSRTPIEGGGKVGRGGGDGVPPPTSTCEPVKVTKVYNAPAGWKLHNARIAAIKDNLVPCVWTHDDKYPASMCEFDPKTTPLIWFDSNVGRYALAGQFTPKTEAEWGKLGSGRVPDFVIGTVVVTETDKRTGAVSHKVTCTPPAPADAAGTSAGYELAASCMIEPFNVSTNASGLQMDNFATVSVCSSEPSADASSAVYAASTASGAKCYRGEGAGLNDPNGTERNASNVYYTGTQRCHVSHSGGVEVYSAKRPATRAFPAKVDELTPIWWRPTSSMKIAN